MRPWSEPGGERWAKIIAWLILALVVGYFAFRLGAALVTRFGSIKRSYQVSAAARVMGRGLALTLPKGLCYTRGEGARVRRLG